MNTGSKFLGISIKEYGLNILHHEHIYVAQGVETSNVQVSSRIGIKKATDKLWRFTGAGFQK